MNFSTLVVIMPAYNEERCIEDAVREVHREILTRVEDARLIVVDDGSTDGTPGLLQELADTLPGIAIYRKDNGGHGSALLFGLRKSEGQYILLLDSDRQIPLSSFSDLWEKRHPQRLICGVRADRQDPLHRLILSSILRLGIRLAFGKMLRDPNAPFKLMPASLWERLRPAIPEDCEAPSLHLAIGAACLPDYELLEEAVPHAPRTAGSSSLHFARLIRFCLRVQWQLFRFRGTLRTTVQERP